MPGSGSSCGSSCSGSSSSSSSSKCATSLTDESVDMKHKGLEVCYEYVVLIRVGND